MITLPVASQEIGASPVAPTAMSCDAFLAWEHPGIAEWVRGEVFTMSVKREHQKVVEFLDSSSDAISKCFSLGAFILHPTS